MGRVSVFEADFRFIVCLYKPGVVDSYFHALYLFVRYLELLRGDALRFECAVLIRYFISNLQGQPALHSM